MRRDNFWDPSKLGREMLEEEKQVRCDSLSLAIVAPLYSRRVASSPAQLRAVAGPLSASRSSASSRTPHEASIITNK